MSDKRDRSTIADDCCDDGMMIVETFSRLKVRGIQILRTMRKEIETFPQFSHVYAHRDERSAYQP